MALASGPAAAVLGAPQPLLVNQDWSVAVGRAVLGALGADVPPLLGGYAVSKFFSLQDLA